MKRIRLTWRNYYGFYVTADSEKTAIDLAIDSGKRNSYLPTGAKLYVGECHSERLVFVK